MFLLGLKLLFDLLMVKKLSEQASTWCNVLLQSASRPPKVTPSRRGGRRKKDSDSEFSDEEEEYVPRPSKRRASSNKKSLKEADSASEGMTARL